MTLKVKILILIILFIVLAIIVNMVRRRDLDLKYVLTWMFCDIALMVLVCFPELMNNMAQLLGIYDPVNMIFFLGFVFSLIIIFGLTVSMSHVTGQVRRMAQIISMLPEDIIKEAIEKSGENEHGKK